MAKFSANLGFLWTELGLADAIRAAARAGFDAVECHLPYHLPVGELTAVLEETGLPMLGLNTAGGEDEAGALGLAALPGRSTEARASVDRALDYAVAAGISHVHVLAGVDTGAVGSRAAYVENLAYAAGRAARHGVRIVIEPLNHRDAPGYFLRGVEQAVEVIDDVGLPNLRLMFDCYHVQTMQGDLMRRLDNFLPYIGHVQIASVPERHEPDEGEIAYERLIPYLERLGYDGFIGAEYAPRRGTEEGLGWLRWFSATR